jgi:homoserine kinase type II
MAVYTEVGDEELAKFVAEYDIGEVLSYKGIAEGIENSNFSLITTSGNYILTLYEKRVNPKHLPFFLGLMDHLAEAGIPCPTPVHGRDKQALRILCGRPAAIVTFLSGMWPKKVTPAHTAELGRAIAELHIAGTNFDMRRHNDLSIAGWRPLFKKVQPRADEILPGLATELEKELSILEESWPDKSNSCLPSGVIHADPFPDNVFFRDGHLTGLIDFYFACNDLFAYDLGICINAWCFEHDLSFNITKARRLLMSYRKVREFSSEELDALPILSRGAAMRFLLTRLYDWLYTPVNALVTRKDPLEYLARVRFHANVSSPADFGLR